MGAERTRKATPAPAPASTPASTPAPAPAPASTPAPTPPAAASEGPRSGLGRALKAPLYHQIYLILRHKILDGAYGEGDLLPGEQELAREFGVSRITARRALDELAAEGLAERRQGRGTFARPPAPTPPVRASFEGFLENLLMMGLKTRARIIEFGYVRASPEVARRLACEPGMPVQRAVRVRSVDGRPLSHLTTHVPADIGSSFSRRDLEASPLLALLERAGVAVEGAEQTISAVLADARVAPLLETEIGAPLLSLERVVRDAEGRAVEWLTALYRPDAYQFRMELSLNRGPGPSLWEPARGTAGGANADTAKGADTDTDMGAETTTRGGEDR